MRTIKRIDSQLCDDMTPIPRKELGGFYSCFAEYFAVPTNNPIPTHLHIYNLDSFRKHRKDIAIPETVTTYSYDREDEQ